MSTAILEAPSELREHYADEDSAIDIEEEIPNSRACRLLLQPAG